MAIGSVGGAARIIEKCLPTVGHVVIIADGDVEKQLETDGCVSGAARVAVKRLIADGHVLVAVSIGIKCFIAISCVVEKGIYSLPCQVQVRQTHAVAGDDAGNERLGLAGSVRIILASVATPRFPMSMLPLPVMML